MNETEYPTPDLTDADTNGRLRVRFLLALAAAVLIVVALQGHALWPRLPDRIPTHFGIGGRPDAWSEKNWFSVFNLLVFAAVLLALMGFAASARLGARWYNFPGKERILILPYEQQVHVLAPLREALAWLGSSCTIAMALMARDGWGVALGQREGISAWLIFTALAIGLTAVALGIIAANRRAGELAPAAE